MGLYLVIFDENDDEIEGVEVGRYRDFGVFRENVELVYGLTKAQGEFSTLMLHSDCDGEWHPRDCQNLLLELNLIKNDFKKKPPITFNNGWQDDIKKAKHLPNNNLYESFIDVDGELLIERLIDLVELSIKKDKPILFQ